MPRLLASQPDPTIEATCDYLQIGRTTVFFLVKADRLRLRKVPGKGRDGAKRVVLPDLRQFLVSERVAA